MGIIDLFRKKTGNSILNYTPSAQISKISGSIAPYSMQSLSVSSEIADLLWIGEGKYKNISPDDNVSQNSLLISSPLELREEPSTLYLSLPVSEPPAGTLIERPPYYPNYETLTPEQRWMYWKFLSNPYSQQNNIGYVFLFYYGLERHLYCGNIDKAFEIILKLRRHYTNSSFQSYSAKALILICIAKQRADLAQKLLEAENQNKAFTISMNYLLILKYTFQDQLSAQEIIKNYQYFGFHNNRYIKNYPDLFEKIFVEIIQKNFNAYSINLSQHFPMDIQQLPVKQEAIFSNLSLKRFEMPIPIFDNPKLTKKVLDMLEETHEAVKLELRLLRQQKTKSSSSKS